MTEDTDFEVIPQKSKPYHFVGSQLLNCLSGFSPQKLNFANSDLRIVFITEVLQF